MLRRGARARRARRSSATRRPPARAASASPGAALRCRVLREGGGRGRPRRGRQDGRAPRSTRRSCSPAEGLDATVIDPRVDPPARPRARPPAPRPPSSSSRPRTASSTAAPAHYLAEQCRGGRAPSPACAARSSSRSACPTRYVAHGKPDAILARLGLDAAGIAASVLAGLGRLDGERREAEVPGDPAAPAGLDRRSERGRCRQRAARPGRQMTPAAALATGSPVAASGVPELDPEAIRAKAGAENFPVAIRLLPRVARAPPARDLRLRALRRRRRRPGAGATAAAQLDWVEAELDRAFAGRADPSGVRAARGDDRDARARSGALPRPLAANRQDQDVDRYPTYEELVGYCALSANPVGRLVLGGPRRTDEPVARELSDRVCTGLQLVEHWQDVGEDFARRAGLPPARGSRALRGRARRRSAPRRAAPAFRRLIAFEVRPRPRAPARRGAPLVGRLAGAPAGSPSPASSAAASRSSTRSSAAATTSSAGR